MSLKTSSYQLGIEAESLVIQYFESLDFCVISQRYKTKFGEIDLILNKNNQIIFVEVKARSRKTTIEEIITKKQLDRNYAAAEFFLSEFPQYSTHDCQFDLMIVYKKKIISHIENIL